MRHLEVRLQEHGEFLTIFLRKSPVRDYIKHQIEIMASENVIYLKWYPKSEIWKVFSENPESRSPFLLTKRAKMATKSEFNYMIHRF